MKVLAVSVSRSAQQHQNRTDEEGDKSSGGVAHRFPDQGTSAVVDYNVHCCIQVDYNYLTGVDAG